MKGAQWVICAERRRQVRQKRAVNVTESECCELVLNEVSHFSERSRFLELCVICEKLMVYRVDSYDIGEV